MSNAAPLPTRATPDDARHLPPAVVIACGVIVSLCVTGYTFMQSNQHVYLLDSLYEQYPQTLARDWFTTHTLQYHVLYTKLSILLDRLGILSGGFFALYLATAIGLHAAWRSVTRSLGGDDRVYLLSVVLYHLSAGGLGLGVYQFLQDGSFLPSNVAAVAALGALACWMADRRYAAAALVAVAGLFHVNYALLLGCAWTFFALLAFANGTRGLTRAFVVQSLIALIPCAFNLYAPVIGALTQTERLPLDVFVPLYIKLRHPHHFDAANWPIALWLSFLWPLPFAFIALRKMPPSAGRRRVRDVFVLALAIEVFATIFAGVWFVSPSLVSLSLFRFSIFAKLLSCLLTAWLIWHAGRTFRGSVGALLVALGIGLLIATGFRDRMPTTVPTLSFGMLIGAGVASLLVGADLVHRLPKSIWTIAAMVGLPITLYLAAGQRLGPAMPGEGDRGIAAVADWSRANTPVESLFLVPPHDSMFRLRAERSAVIGFKHVPQLVAELFEWKRRLDDVLDVDVLTLRSGTMQGTADAMAERYANLPAAHLASVANTYDCDYILAMSDLGPAWRDRLVHVSFDRRYWLYRVRLDIATQPSTLPAETQGSTQP